MLDKKMEDAFNDQINKELYSEYLYLAMKAIFADLNLPGFVNWFDVQVQEERAHAMGMFDYVFERNGCVKLEAIDKPEIKGSTALSFLDWYLKEQVEEEANVGGVLANLKLIGDDKKALFMLDKELAARVFNPPVIG